MDMSKAPETPGLNPDSPSPVFLETKLVFDFYFPSPAYSLSRQHPRHYHPLLLPPTSVSSWLLLTSVPPLPVAVLAPTVPLSLCLRLSF